MIEVVRIAEAAQANASGLKCFTHALQAKLNAGPASADGSTVQYGR